MNEIDTFKEVAKVDLQIEGELKEHAKKMPRCFCVVRAECESGSSAGQEAI